MAVHERHIAEQEKDRRQDDHGPFAQLNRYVHLAGLLTSGVRLCDRVSDR